MGTIKRRRRKQRSQFTQAMLEQLIFGSVMLAQDEACFETVEEEREAWHRTRHLLLAEHTSPGHRPNAFFRFDLGEEQAFRWQWWQEIEALERNGLLNREEEVAIESIHRGLAGDQSEHLYERLRDPKVVFGEAKYCGSVSDQSKISLRRQETEFAFVAGWHARRGRVGLEAKYLDLALAHHQAREMAGDL